MGVVVDVSGIVVGFCMFDWGLWDRGGGVGWCCEVLECDGERDVRLGCIV